LFTRNGKGLTAQGVKPICKFQQVFKSLYLFGAYSPFTGDHFELELSHCNTDNFELFLKEFSKVNPEEFKIMLLDNGSFHKAKSLIIPDNIALLFIPPYSPELNPAEKIWWKMKRAFTNRLHKSLDEVSDFIKDQVIKLTKSEIIAICSFDYIVLAQFWTNLY
jgi:transposase